MHGVVVKQSRYSGIASNDLESVGCVELAAPCADHDGWQSGVHVHQRSLNLERGLLVPTVPMDDMSHWETRKADLANPLELVALLVLVDFIDLLADVREHDSLTLPDIEDSSRCEGR